MRAYIKTYGCSLNQADSDVARSILSDSGIDVSGSPGDSDVIIINSCTVKSATAQKILYELDNLRKAGRNVVVTGCMAGANRDLIEKHFPAAGIVTTQNIDMLPHAVSESALGRRVVLDGYKRLDRASLSKPAECTIAKVPINDGCLSSCTFCETKFARGPLNSFSEDSILNAVRYSAAHGAAEIDLSSQDCGAYGRDRKSDIAGLMKRIDGIEGDFKVRVGMMNPEHMRRYLEEMLSIMEGSDRFYRFIHMPVESGSDHVLEGMRRKYTVEDAEELIGTIRDRLRDVTIETDIIVGFPTETRSDFDDTMEFIERARPDVTNISRFGARPHTAAAGMEQLGRETINSRSNELSREVRRVQRDLNERHIGSKYDTLITETTGTSYNGRNMAYKQIVVRGSNQFIKEGTHYNVVIDEVSANVLYGHVAGN